jgi:hypothetical protein
MQKFYKHLIIFLNNSHTLTIEIVIAYIMQQKIKTTNDTHAPKSHKSFIFYFEMNKTFSHMYQKWKNDNKNLFLKDNQKEANCSAT